MVLRLIIARRSPAGLFLGLLQPRSEKTVYEIRKTLDRQGRLSGVVVCITEMFATAYAALQPGEHIVDLRRPYRQYHWLPCGSEVGWVYLQ